jgi:peroxiredoxin (alkyl hydroperoxide reductase subunit C)
MESATGGESMLGVGEHFPYFSLIANVSADEETAFVTVTDKDFVGAWKVYFFWPKDFSPESLEEIIDLGALESEFRDRKTQLVGGSVESEYAHLAWRIYDHGLRRVSFPLLADIRRDLCGQLGILDENEGVSQRATFIVDPQGIIRFVYVTENNVSRDPGEVLRVLSDLQTRPC